MRYTLPAAEVTLADGTQAADAHEATFDATGLPSGVYLTRLTVGERSATRKLLVVR